MECPQTTAPFNLKWSSTAAASAANVFVLYFVDGLPDFPVPR
jgi:hypothetical protein